MPKSWQEIEFLDYKERQVRRRSQKTRELQQIGPGQSGERSRLKRLMVFGTLFLALLGGGIVSYQRFGRELGLTTGSRSVLRVDKVWGEVETSSSTTGWEPLKAGSTISSGSHVRTGKNGKVVLRPSLPDSRIILFENATLMFEKIQVSAKNPDSAALSFEMEKGEAVFDFPKGGPLLKVALPMIAVYSQIVRYKARISKDENRVLVGRFAVQAEDRADPTKKVIVPDGHELVATLRDPVGKPRGAAGATMSERWE